MKKTPADHEHRDKLWGSEEWVVNNALYCGKLLRIKKGASCSLHFHTTKHETFYCQSGLVRIMLEDDGERMITRIVLEPGCSIEVPPKCPHMFVGLEDSVLIEFSTHHEDSDSHRITQSQPPGELHEV
jgi:oxalate decarboxylase/phosphoglucose isomerase-like protein (cupin superfamily)